MATHRPLALRFLSGPFQGRAMTLDSRRPLLIGRQPDADIVLTEDLVSRRHASIGYEGEALVVQDLGSTNGTYVNGARVERARLEEGDRVIVGGSILRVVRREAVAADSAGRNGPEGGAITAVLKVASAMQGRLEEVPLPDLLQLLANARKSGVLLLRHEDHVAELRLHEGKVAGCLVDGRDDHPVVKGFYRLMRWSAGTFELRPAPGDAPSPGSVLDAQLDALMMEGMRHKDEMHRLRPLLPPRLAPSEITPTGPLEPDDRALLALVTRNGLTDAVLDATPLPDLVAAERLVALLDRGLLAPA